MSIEESRGPDGNSSSDAFSSASSRVAERAVLMCASALFTGLSQRECMEIASCARARTFARDEILFTQGQPVRSLILLESGSVKSTTMLESNAFTSISSVSATASGATAVSTVFILGAPPGPAGRDVTAGAHATREAPSRSSGSIFVM